MDIDEKIFFDKVRADFGGLTQGQVNGFKRFLYATDDLDITWRAYILATVWHETGQEMQPVRETKAKTDQAAVNILEKAFKSGKLKWVQTPYWRYDQEGKTWIGRGDVQLTHKDNYRRASKFAGVDLVAFPDKMLDPAISAKVAVQGMIEGVFTGKRLSDYLPGDYKGARRIINGQESASKVAALAVKFEDALRAASIVTAPVIRDTLPSTNWLADLIETLLGIFKK